MFSIYIDFGSGVLKNVMTLYIKRHWKKGNQVNKKYQQQQR